MAGVRRRRRRRGRRAAASDGRLARRREAGGRRAASSSPPSARPAAAALAPPRTSPRGAAPGWRVVPARRAKAAERLGRGVGQGGRGRAGPRGRARRASPAGARGRRSTRRPLGVRRPERQGEAALPRGAHGSRAMALPLAETEHRATRACAPLRVSIAQCETPRPAPANPFRAAAPQRRRAGGRRRARPLARRSTSSRRRRAAKARGSRLHLLPECFLPGYGRVHSNPALLCDLAPSRAARGVRRRRREAPRPLDHPRLRGAQRNGRVPGAAAVLCGDTGRVVLHHRKRRLVGEHKCFATAADGEEGGPAGGPPEARERAAPRARRGRERRVRRAREEAAAAPTWGSLPMPPPNPPPPPPSERAGDGGRRGGRRGPAAPPRLRPRTRPSRSRRSAAPSRAPHLRRLRGGRWRGPEAPRRARSSSLPPRVPMDPDRSPRTRQQGDTPRSPTGSTPRASRCATTASRPTAATPRRTRGQPPRLPGGRRVAGPRQPGRGAGISLRARYGALRRRQLRRPRRRRRRQRRRRVRRSASTPVRRTIVGDFGLSLRFQLDWRRSNRTSWHMCRSNDSEDGGDD